METGVKTALAAIIKSALPTFGETDDERYVMFVSSRRFTPGGSADDDTGVRVVAKVEAIIDIILYHAEDSEIGPLLVELADTKALPVVDQNVQIELDGSEAIEYEKIIQEVVHVKATYHLTKTATVGVTPTEQTVEESSIDTGNIDGVTP